MELAGVFCGIGITMADHLMNSMSVYSYFTGRLACAWFYLRLPFQWSLKVFQEMVTASEAWVTSNRPTSVSW